MPRQARRAESTEDHGRPTPTRGYARSMSRTKIVHGQHLRPPYSCPRTPVPVADAGTSTATASISRLYTKGTHSSSTVPLAPSAVGTEAVDLHLHVPVVVDQSDAVGFGGYRLHNSSTTLSLPDLVGKVLGGVCRVRDTRRRIGSGLDLPKLPESYASTRPPSQRFKDKQAQRRSRSRKAPQMVRLVQLGGDTKGTRRIR